MAAELSIDPSHLKIPLTASRSQEPLVPYFDAESVRSSLDTASATSTLTTDLSEFSKTQSLGSVIDWDLGADLSASPDAQLFSSDIDWNFGADSLLDPFPSGSNPTDFLFESDDSQLMNMENTSRIDSKFALDQATPADLIYLSPKINDSDPLAGKISTTQWPETHDDPQMNQDSALLTALCAPHPADEAQEAIEKGSIRMTSPLIIANDNAGSTLEQSLKLLPLPVHPKTFAKICDQSSVGAGSAVEKGPERLEV